MPVPERLKEEFLEKYRRRGFKITPIEFINLINHFWDLLEQAEEMHNRPLDKEVIIDEQILENLDPELSYDELIKEGEDILFPYVSAVLTAQEIEAEREAYFKLLREKERLEKKVKELEEKGVSIPTDLRRQLKDISDTLKSLDERVKRIEEIKEVIGKVDTKGIIELEKLKDRLETLMLKMEAGLNRLEELKEREREVVIRPRVEVQLPGGEFFRPSPFFYANPVGMKYLELLGYIKDTIEKIREVVSGTTETRLLDAFANLYNGLKARTKEDKLSAIADFKLEVEALDIPEDLKEELLEDIELLRRFIASGFG